MPPSIITLTTDFGLSDPYVASMKGVILGLNPHATIVDITHDIRAQDIEHGAFLLGSATRYFPPGTVHLAIVDPGVGTDRRGISLAGREAVFIGPDNGLLSPGLPETVREQASAGGSIVPLPGEVHAYDLTNDRFHLRPTRSTFHGRDIFAPVAAHVSLGVPLAEFGPVIADIITLPLFRAESVPGALRGRVMHIDHFGNIITNISERQLQSGDVTMPGDVTLEVAGREIGRLVLTYGHADGLAAIFGGSGFLEIALPGGSAADELQALPGTPVVLKLPTERPGTVSE